jgi:hypothetical protein
MGIYHREDPRRLRIARFAEARMEDIGCVIGNGKKDADPVAMTERR